MLTSSDKNRRFLEMAALQSRKTKEEEEVSTSDKLKFIFSFEERKLKKGLYYRPDIDLIDLKYQLLKLGSELKVPKHFVDLMKTLYCEDDQLLIALFYALVFNQLLQMIPDDPKITKEEVENLISENVGVLLALESASIYDKPSHLSDKFIPLVSSYWPRLTTEINRYLAYFINMIYDDLTKATVAHDISDVNHLFHNLWPGIESTLITSSQVTRYLLLNLYDSIKMKQEVKKLLAHSIPSELSHLIEEYISKY